MDHKSGIPMLDVFRDVWLTGKEYSPRGQRTVEIENYMFQVQGPFSSFKARHMSLSYLKKEFLWYLSADPYNTDIMEAAPGWERFRQSDGRWFSNYGYYWFNINSSEGMSGFDWVVKSLSDDPESRQAVIPMLSKDHLFKGNPDVVCTECISFRIRDGRLNMSVNMRSSDIIWGYGNDLPCFWWLWEMVALALGIPCGFYIHKSDSLHVYEKHYEMIQEIIAQGASGYYHIEYPPITDVQDLLRNQFQSPFGRWLIDY